MPYETVLWNWRLEVGGWKLEVVMVDAAYSSNVGVAKKGGAFLDP